MAFPIATDIFPDLGQMVKLVNRHVTLTDALDIDTPGVQTQFNDDVADVEFGAVLVTQNDTSQTRVDGSISPYISLFQTYMTTIGKEHLESTFTSFADNLTRLIEEMNNQAETVDGNDVGVMLDFVETNDGSNQLSAYRFNGLALSTFDSDLKLYVSIIDNTGDFDIEVYDDAARGGGDLIAMTSAVFTGAGPVTLIEQNSSGVTGTITVDTGAPAADADIILTFSFGGVRLGTGTVSALAATQMAKDDFIRLECTSNATEGSELWRIFSQERGRISGDPGQVTTDVAFPSAGVDDKAGLTVTIEPSVAAVANDGAAQLSNVDLVGVTPVTNSSAAGVVFCKLLGTGVTAPTDTNDGAAQLDAWVFTGPIHGSAGTGTPNSDTAGKVYIDLMGKATAITEAGDGTGQISGYTAITGLVLVTNTDTDGKIYISIVDDTGGFFHVDIYKDVARAAGDLVGHTATYNGTGAEAVLPDNASGLGGTVTIDLVGPADVDINVTFPFVQVSVYSDSARLLLVAQSAWTLGSSNGPLTGDTLPLAVQNSSGLTGTVDVTYTADDADIFVTLPFLRFECYKETGRTTLVSLFDWTYDADATIAGAALVGQGGSGMTGTLDMAFSADDVDIEITDVPYQVGDQYLFELVVTEDGTFQTFFRDFIDRPLPFVLDGSETIADTLAEP